MAIDYPKGQRLADIILDGFDNSSKPVLVNTGNPMKIIFDGIPYYVYMKCISWKGNPYPENDTRAQLPKRPEFDAIKASADRFVFLGYDPVCDVVACWNPTQVKARLNNKTYTSFYSKKDLQEEVKDGKFISAQLSNGDKFVLFKRKDIAAFLSMIENHFPSIKEMNESNFETPDLPQEDKVEVIGMLLAIEDDIAIKDFIDERIPKNSKIQIVADCFNTFGNKYFGMKFQNWASVITSYIENHGKES